jgi:hypothetical protein
MVILMGLIGCGGGNTDTGPVYTGDGGGACGEVTEFSVTIRGLVTRDGVPEEGASVSLEELAWTNGEYYGSTNTDANGLFALEVEDLVSVEDCWGSALDYVLTAVRGTDSAEDDINSHLFGAWYDGVSDVDLMDWPMNLGGS